MRCALAVEWSRKRSNTLANSLWGKAKDRFGICAQAQRGRCRWPRRNWGAFARSSEDVETPDLQYHVQPLSLDAFGGAVAWTFPPSRPSVCNLRPQSRGVVEIASPNPLEAPRIAPNYLSDPADRRIAVAGDPPGAPDHGAGADAALCASRDAARSGGPMMRRRWVKAAGDIGTNDFPSHLHGCEWGADETAPLDAMLRVRGVGALRVVDASVMPRITSGNTNAPTIMIAEKAADLILATG